MRGVSRAEEKSRTGFFSDATKLLGELRAALLFQRILDGEK